jgi:hypothetical protein
MKLQNAQKITQIAADEIRGRELDCFSNGTGKMVQIFRCKVVAGIGNGQS